MKQRSIRSRKAWARSATTHEFGYAILLNRDGTVKLLSMPRAAAHGAPTVLTVNIPNGPRVVRVHTDAGVASWSIEGGAG